MMDDEDGRLVYKRIMELCNHKDKEIATSGFEILGTISSCDSEVTKCFINDDMLKYLTKSYSS